MRVQSRENQLNRRDFIHVAGLATAGVLTGGFFHRIRCK